jgi:glycoprotein endo-alpha-1,2-mannosidase
VTHSKAKFVLICLFMIGLCSTGRADVLVGTYYYPWHTGSSFHGGNPPGSTTLRYHLDPQQVPESGWYDQKDVSVISRHYKWARYAGIDFFVCSYWGRSSKTNTVIKDHMFDNPDRGDIKLCVFLETNITPKNDNATTESITAEINYLCDNYFNRPGYFRVDGKPVIFIYVTRAFSDADLTMCLDAIRTAAANKGVPGVYIVGDEVWGSPNIAAKTPRVKQMDAITNYDVYGNMGRSRFVTDSKLNSWQSKNDAWKSLADSLGKKFVPAISPGYNDRAVRGEDDHPACSRKLNNKSNKFGTLFSGMIDRLDPNVGMVMVNSWNEWHEDTQIEPVAVAAPTSIDDSSEKDYYTEGLEYNGYGTLYLDILRKRLKKNEK